MTDNAESERTVDCPRRTVRTVLWSALLVAVLVAAWQAHVLWVAPAAPTQQPAIDLAPGLPPSVSPAPPKAGSLQPADMKHWLALDVSLLVGAQAVSLVPKAVACVMRRSGVVPSERRRRRGGGGGGARAPTQHGR